MTISHRATATGANIGLSVAAGPGNVPVNERQVLTVKATAGEYDLTFRSPNPGSTFQTTATIPFNAPASGPGSVQAALEALSNIGAGNVTVSEGPGDETGTTPYLIEFTGGYADVNVRKITTTNVSLSGGNPSGAAITTAREGGGAVETCTTVCTGETVAEGQETGQGSGPGQLRWSDALAIDNDPSSGSYGAVYVLDQRNLRVQKYSAAGATSMDTRRRSRQGDLSEPLHGGRPCRWRRMQGRGTGYSTRVLLQGWQQPFVHHLVGNEGNNSIAVGPGGRVYVGDFGRVPEFEPDGSYVGSLEPNDAEPLFVSALAVDSSGNIYERSATYNGFGSPITGEVSGVRKFTAAHSLASTFATEAGNEITHIGLDSAGDLLASVFNSGSLSLRAYRPSGQLSAIFTSDQVGLFTSATTFNNPEGIAVGDGNGDLYVTAKAPEGSHVAGVPIPVPGKPAITELHVSDVQPTTTTILADVNPKGFETGYHFEYVDQQSFDTEGGFASSHTHVTTVGTLDSVDQKNHVQAAISGLTPGTNYQYRVVATNLEGTTYGSGEIETLSPVSIRNLTTQTVGPNLVSVKAELNPNGSPSTYVIAFGGDVNYLGGNFEGSLPTGNEFVSVEATFSGLESGASYHYRLTAENGNGSVASGDHMFTTEMSEDEVLASEGCPQPAPAGRKRFARTCGLPSVRASEPSTQGRRRGLSGDRVGAQRRTRTLLFRGCVWRCLVQFSRRPVHRPPWRSRLDQPGDTEATWPALLLSRVRRSQLQPCKIRNWIGWVFHRDPWTQRGASGIHQRRLLLDGSCRRQLYIPCHSGSGRPRRGDDQICSYLKSVANLKIYRTSS